MKRGWAQFAERGAGGIRCAVFVVIAASAACTGPPAANDIRASGYVEATDVRLASKIGGRIVLLNVNVGDRVKANTLVARIDSRDIELNIDRARTAKSEAEAQLQLLQVDARPEDLGAARARVAAAQAQVATAEAALNDTSVRSPTAGIVAERLVEVGEVIGPRSPIAVIGNLAEAWADVFVSEPLHPRLRLGQAAIVFADASGSGRAGTVSYISAKAEVTPRNAQNAAERSKLAYRVRVEVDNKDGVLKRGMPVEALIALQAAQ